MEALPHPAIIGLDVSRDTLDIHCLPDGFQIRLPNTGEGHAQLERIARDRRALVCFEATGGHEWLLRARLDEAGTGTRQLPPAQIKAFASSGRVRAKTDRLDAETIARFMAFRPEAGCRLPHAKLRSLRSLAAKRKQLVDALKRHSMQRKARKKHGTASEFEGFDNEFKELLDRQIKELERRIETLLASDAALAGTAAILRSIPGIGPMACAMLIAEMPELRQIAGDQAAALRGKGKPHKVVVTAVARKLPAMANALCKTRRSWAAQAA